MTNATQIIEAFNKLSADEQNQVTEFVLTRQSNEIFELTEEEMAELDRRLNSNEKTIPAEEVFAKYGL